VKGALARRRQAGFEERRWALAEGEIMSAGSAEPSATPGVVECVDVRREHFLAALRDSAPEVRDAASRALEWLERREDLATLLLRAQAADHGMRVAAIYELGTLADPAALPVLVNALRDPVEDVRVVAVRTLGELREASAVAPIAQCLDDPSMHVRRHAIEALGRFADRRLAPLLGPMLAAPESEIVATAVRALGACRDAAWAPEVIALLQHDDSNVRAASIEALAQLG
jgi:HEAT repeat protein